MALYRATGIVLRTYKVAEADRIAVLFTVEHGKIRTVVKGVRKTTARHGLRLEPLSHVALQLYRGRELDTVTQVQGLDAFPGIRNDLDRLARAAILLEAVELSMPDREPDERRYQLLIGALRAMESRDRPLVVSGMLLKLLALDGVVPVTDVCTGCGRPDELVALDPEAGGARCRGCRSGMLLTPRGFELARMVLGGRLGAALNEERSPDTESLDRVVLATIERHLERRLRSATVNTH
ncbi:MAG: DNA repair protein RecO [Acidimicrobiales bacterium]|nr:DNA repair protein RecO [Acidimicrobiales bacterium]